MADVEADDAGPGWARSSDPPERAPEFVDGADFAAELGGQFAVELVF